ncbi:MAG: putative CRISPR-associated protein [Calditrichaeota bacterium]|nr:MAG: putative CRISPR-associated protein [Calditrichota bacterium]
MQFNLTLSSVLRKKIQPWIRNQESAAAEIYSLLKLQKKVGKQLEVYLLASETILSRLAVEILYEELQNHQQIKSVNFDPKVDVIPGLQVADPSYFRDTGLLNLMKRINDIVDNAPKKAIINMTGGFKAVVPFLAIYGQLYGVPTYYIFEEAEELIQIPEFPINFDFSLVEDYYTAFEDANKGNVDKLKTKSAFLINLDNDPGKAEKLLENFVRRQLFKIAETEKVSLTVYGKLLFEYFKTNYSSRGDSGNFIGEFMELKLYEFLITTRPKDLKIFHSHKFDNYEADLLIVDHNQKTVEVIECKPGGNVPFSDIKKKKIKGLLPEVKKQYRDYEIHFLIYCYHQSANWKHLQSKMHETSQLATQFGADKVKWYWIQTDKLSTQKISKQNIQEINLEEV